MSLSRGGVFRASAPSLRWYLFFSFLAGALLPLGFAPIDFWPLTVLSPAVLLFLLIGQSSGRAFWIGYTFGLGQFGVGVSWVYLSFTLFGGAIAPIAALITILFFGALALYTGLTTWLAVRVGGGRQGTDAKTARSFWRLALAFSGCWVLVEWVRGWILSGFPWLDLGVAQVDSPLSGYLPLVGEYGVSLLVVLMAALLAWIGVLRRFRPGAWRQPALWGTASIAVLMGLGIGLGRIPWTQPVGKPLTVGVAQANIPQMQKFDPAFLNQTLHTYVALSDRIGSADLIIWPETAIPDVLSNLAWFHEILEKRSAATHTDYLVGTFTQDAEGRYYNSLVGIPSRVGSHRKAHLVPFSEYMPLRPVMDLFAGLIDIPMSDLTPGAVNQPLPIVGGVRIGPSICYEADFARDVRHDLPAAGLLVNVSNDSWFGDSLAPHQNLQMAAVRALEFGRPMVRATNTGISAFIDVKGRTTQALGVNRQGILKGDVQPYQGTTPFYHLQSWPIVLLTLLILFGIGYWRRTAPHQD